MKELYCNSLEELKDNLHLFPDNHIFQLSTKFVEEWSFERNKGINLLRLPTGKKFWLTCEKCGSDYDKAVNTAKMAVKNSGKDKGLCNYCVGKMTNQTNSVFATNPEVKVMWSKNNTIDPNTIRASSRTKVLWECQTCHEEFGSAVGNLIIAQNTATKGCPYCRGFKANDKNSIASLYPELLKEWSEDNEHKLTDVTVASDKRINWVCKLGHTWNTMASDRIKTKSNGEEYISSCPYCANYKVWKGFNDIPTLYPHLIENFVNEEEKYKWNYGSGEYVEWKCTECNTIVGRKAIKNVVVNGISCALCSKNTEQPERFLTAVLKHLGIKFDHNQGKPWIKGKQYDFYLPEYNAIIELHGEQHYKDVTGKKFTRTPEEEQKNDKLKRDVALKNGIEHYFEIPILTYSFQGLKQILNNSELYDFLDLDKVDWHIVEMLFLKPKELKDIEKYQTTILK